MRVNIITQPLFLNYGGILQNFALQKVLRDLGHQPLTINRPVLKRSCPLWKEIAYTFRNFTRLCKHQWEYPTLLDSKIAKLKYAEDNAQRRFISKYINKVDILPPFTAQKLADYHADAYVVGSDQVWRPWCSPYMSNCFFDFTEGEDVRRIAYAASFGTDQWEMDEDTTKSVSELAKHFDAISVRESSGIDLCQRHLGVSAIHMPDPTLLISPEEYLSLTSPSDHPEGKYIATYILDPEKIKSRKIKEISSAADLPAVKIGKMTKNGFDSIEQWLSTIAHAQEVITDSFHGTVFSLIFGKKVTILANNLRGNARLESLIEMCGFDKDQRVLIPNDDTRKIINDLRKRGSNFLKSNLS